MNTKLIQSLFGFLMLVQLNFVYAELKDPRTRDETISYSTIQVEVTREGNMYRYDYRIQSGAENLGVVSKFKIDLTCDLDFGDITIPVPDTRLGYLGNLSRDGKHVPAELLADYGTSNAYAVSIYNYAMWGVYIRPGSELGNVSILSPAPPGLVTYMLEPLMTNDPSWDYESYPEDDPTVPWIEDFTVTGKVSGPACKKDDPNGNLFQGTGFEPFDINGILKYSQPLSDPVFVKSTTETLSINIYYSELLNKHSFKAKLNGVDISNIFRPIPGTNQTVVLNGPWKNRNKLIISALGLTDGRVKGTSQEKRPDQSNSTPAQNNAAIEFDEFKSKDVDTFHIYIQESNDGGK